MLENNSKISTSDYSPVFVFVLVYFLIHLIDFHEATNFVVASLFTLVAYMVEIHFAKEEFIFSKESLSKTNFYTGILTFTFFLIVIIGILNWFRIVSTSIRMGSLIVAMVFYIAQIFKAIHVLVEVKLNSKKK